MDAHASFTDSILSIVSTAQGNFTVLIRSNITSIHLMKLTVKCAIIQISVWMSAALIILLFIAGMLSHRCIYVGNTDCSCMLLDNDSTPFGTSLLLLTVMI